MRICLIKGTWLMIGTKVTDKEPSQRWESHHQYRLKQLGRLAIAAYPLLSLTCLGLDCIIPISSLQSDDAYKCIPASLARLGFGFSTSAAWPKVYETSKSPYIVEAVLYVLWYMREGLASETVGTSLPYSALGYRTWDFVNAASNTEPAFSRALSSKCFECVWSARVACGWR